VARIDHTKMGILLQVIPGPVVDDGDGEVEAGRHHAEPDDGEAHE